MLKTVDWSSIEYSGSLACQQHDQTSVPWCTYKFNRWLSEHSRSAEPCFNWPRWEDQRSQLIKKATEWVSDKATGERTGLLNHEWVSVERIQPHTHTQQGLGEQHLQSTVNMGNEQSGLFPLGLYNERKTTEMTSHWRKKKVLVGALQHSKHKLLVWMEEEKEWIEYGWKRYNYYRLKSRFETFI